MLRFHRLPLRGKLRLQDVTLLTKGPTSMDKARMNGRAHLLPCAPAECNVDSPKAGGLSLQARLTDQISSRQGTTTRAGAGGVHLISLPELPYRSSILFPAILPKAWEAIPRESQAARTGFSTRAFPGMSRCRPGRSQERGLLLESECCVPHIGKVEI